VRRAVASALVVAIVSPRAARGEAGSTQADAGAQGSATAPAPAPTAPVPATGVAVLARAGAEQAAWALAKELYARPSLRPPSLDEPRARVLVGDPAAPGAPPAVKDLADERAGIHGDDGGSRALLRAIAAQLNVRALVVVEVGASGAPSAGVFLAESAAFDAARYNADPSPPPPPSPAASPGAGDAGAPSLAETTSDGGVGPPAPVPPPPPRWSGTVASLERSFGGGGPETHAPALATSPLPPQAPKQAESHPFYTSPWFWGALGAAAFGGAAVYFATRDNSTQTIHLELQVPK